MLKDRYIEIEDGKEYGASQGMARGRAGATASNMRVAVTVYRLVPVATYKPREPEVIEYDKTGWSVGDFVEFYQDGTPCGRTIAEFYRHQGTGADYVRWKEDGYDTLGALGEKP